MTCTSEVCPRVKRGREVSGYGIQGKDVHRCQLLRNHDPYLGPGQGGRGQRGGNRTDEWSVRQKVKVQTNDRGPLKGKEKRVSLQTKQ